MVRASLKYKLVSALALTFASIFLTQLSIHYYFVLPTYAKLERQHDIQDIKIVANALKSEFNQLKNLLYDNSAWDEMYQAIYDKNINWIQDNYFIKESYLNLHLNGWYFYDKTLQPIAGLSADKHFNSFQVSQFEHPSPFIKNQLLISADEVKKNNLTPLHKFGISLINNQLAMIVTHSIAPSNEIGESAGVSLV